jgi:serine/threonine-protein kinase
MGVVYQVWQPGLGRMAALKVVLAGPHAGPEHRARFRTEAEAVARLQHPNIVPIYEVGEHDGRPYMLLEYVQGGSLARKLGGTPLPARQGAELVETLARAIHHAHQKGVIHRDLTPGNILLTPEGQPKVTDFGLAKLLVGGEGRTQSGAILGTPSYMAPEQAGGRSKGVGPATDVYALGAVLYECLTGRPPFKAETPLETLLQVVDAEPARPAQLQPKVPRDLETICLKCLQKNPARRYASAAALADDLRRFLAGEPIQARPVSSWERGVKWARRRPALAGLVGVSGAATLALLIGGAVYNARLEAALREARAQRLRAEENFRQAREAVDRFIARIRDSRLREVPGLRPLHRQLLEEALTYYQNFLRQRPDDPALTAEWAVIQSRAASVLWMIGTNAEVTAAYQQARAAWEKVLAQNPNDRHARLELARVWVNLGTLHAQTAAPADALLFYQRGCDLYAQGAELAPDDPEVRGGLGGAYHSLGNLYSRLGRPTEAQQAYEQARDVLEKLVQSAPDVAKFQEYVARLHADLGAYASARGQRGHALQAYQRAGDLFQKLLNQDPRSTNYQDMQANNHRHIGLEQVQTGQMTAALESFRKARAIWHHLSETCPEVAQYQHRLARTHYSIADWHERSQQTAEALACFQQARVLQEGLAKRDPDQIDFLRDLASTCMRLGAVQLRIGLAVEAVGLYERSVEILQGIVARHPDRVPDRSSLGDALNDLGLALVAANRPAAALRAYEQAIPQQQAALAQAPEVVRYRRDLGYHYFNLANVQRRLGRLTDAAVTIRKYQDLWPQAPGVLYEVAIHWAQCVRLVGGGKADLPAAEQAQRQHYADEAVNALRLAIARGYKDLDRLKKEKDLDCLRGRDDFQQLVRDLERGRGGGEVVPPSPATPVRVPKGDSSLSPLAPQPHGRCVGTGARPYAHPSRGSADLLWLGGATRVHL